MAFAMNYYAIQQWMNATLVWMRHNCMHKSSNVVIPTIFLVLLMFFTWKTLASDTDFGSCRHFVCNMFRRALASNLPNTLACDFGGNRGDDESIDSEFRASWHLPLFQESWLAQSCWGWWHWNSFAQMSNPVFWALFRLIQKKCILVHIPVSPRKYLSFMGTTVQNTVCRPSFTSFLPAIRPDWSMGSQETEEPTCWMCSSKRTGLVHCPAMIIQLDFFLGSVGKHAHTEYFRLNPNTSLLVASSLLMIQTIPASSTFLIRGLRDKACITPFTPSSSRRPSWCWKKKVILFEKFQQWSSLTEYILFHFRYLIGKSTTKNEDDRSCSVLCPYASCQHACWWPSKIESLLSSENRSWFHFRHGHNVLEPWLPGPDQFGVASNKSFQLASFVTPRVRIFSTKTCWTVSCSFSCKTSVVANSDDWKSSHQSFPGLDDSRLDTYPPMELATPNSAPLTQQVSPCIVDNELRLVEEVPGANPRWLRTCRADWQG